MKSCSVEIKIITKIFMNDRKACETRLKNIFTQNHKRYVQ